MTRLLRALLRDLIVLPLELLRILLLFLQLLWKLIISLILFLLGKPWRGRDRPIDPEKCHDTIPPHVRRKPDPCLYSQSYLMQQGIPVSWDNPDIWLTELNGTLVDSSQLQADHTYIINGRIWDASFDPALAVEVRCFFQNWGINGPQIPVETNPDGTARAKLLNISPWGNAIAQFHWTTPAVSGHFCLKVACAHPDDRNPANNVGQENTEVHGGSPGQTITTRVHILNPFQRPARVILTADTYRIPDRKWEFPLQTQRRELGEPPQILSGGDQRRGLGQAIRQWLAGAPGGGPRNIRYDYLGRDPLLKAQREAPAAFPPGWGVTIDGSPLRTPLILRPGESRDLEFRVQIPNTAQVGEQWKFNFNATIPERGPLGGVTLRISVQ
jgi:hypothetical protein